MAITKKISSAANVKQKTQADLPITQSQTVTAKYGPVTSSGGQTVINLSFAVDQTNKLNFLLSVDGKILSEVEDYNFTNIQPDGSSSQVTLTASLIAGLNIQAWYLGVIMPVVSLSSIQAQTGQTASLAAKNYLINGAFDYWQRGFPGSAVDGVSAYFADRWYIKNSLGTDAVLGCTRVTGVLSGSKYGCQVSIVTAPTALETNGCELYQVIENRDSMELLDKVVSFSANLKAMGNVTTVGLQICYATTEVKPNLFLGSELSVPVNTSSFSVGQLVNQAISGLPTAAGVVGVRIRVLTVSTGDVWDVGNGFVVEQAILNEGTSAASFKRAGRNTQDELAMCQRFFEKSYNLDVGPATITVTGAAIKATNGDSSGQHHFDIHFSVYKRSDPQVDLYDSDSGTFGQWEVFASNAAQSGYSFTLQPASVTVQASSQGGFLGYAAAFGSYAPGRVYGHWIADSEI